VERQLTGWASGLPFYDYQGLGLDEAISVWQTLCSNNAQGRFAGKGAAALGPDEPVERVYWSDAWVPVARDRDGNLLLVDLGPEETGIVGQLLSWSMEQGPIAVLASGLTPYLRLLSARLRAGRIKLDKRTGALLPS
jgi:cell wall assembly regulator SMI1